MAATRSTCKRCVDGLLHAALLALLLVSVPFLSNAGAESNFVPVRLRHDVQVELPKNWTVLSENQRVLLSTWLQVHLEAKNMFDASHELVFAANYYDDSGRTIGIFNARYYPNLDVTQAEVATLAAEDIAYLDTELKKEVTTGAELSRGIHLVNWSGTKRLQVNNLTALLSEYERTSPSGGTFIVRLLRVLNAHKSFTITISYHRDQERLLRPICDRIIGSVAIGRTR